MSRPMLASALGASALAIIALAVTTRVWLAPGTVNPVGAADGAIQSVTEDLRASESISASWRRTPVAGRLLVAIAGAEGSVMLRAPEGWQTAVTSEGETGPAEAIYYKVAEMNEKPSVLVRASARTDMGLQLYEFARIHPSEPFLAAATLSGGSTVAESGTIDIASTPALLIGGFVVDRGVSLLGGWSDAFTVTNAFKSFGGSAAFAGGQLLATTNGTYGTTVDLGRNPALWRGAIVGFRREETGLSGAASEEALPDIALSAVASTERVLGTAAVRVQITAKNIGEAAAHDLSIRLPIPRSLRADAASASHGGYALGDGFWDVGTIAPGGQATLILALGALPETDTTVFVTATVDGMLEEEASEENNEAAVRLDVRGPASSQTCAEIINGSANVTVRTGVWTVQTSAPGTTRLLVGDTADRNEAFLRVPGTFTFPAPADGDLYLWFGNACKFGAPIRITPPIPTVSFTPQALL